MTPIRLPKGMVAPLSDTKRPGTCVACSEPRANWEYRVDPVGCICGHCLLYGTPWGIGQSESVKNLITKIEEQTKERLPQDLEGRLLTGQDADRIVQAVYMTSQLMERGAQMYARKSHG